MTSRPRRVLGMALAAGLAAASAVSVAAPAAASEEGLTVQANSRYVVAAKSETVRAAMTLDLRNVSPDREGDGGVYTYYFDAYAVPIPTSSQQVVARSEGSTLPVSVRATDDPSTSLARISFPNLTYGERRRIELTFDIVGEAPRSPDQTRVGPGYATFVAYGPGDEGRNTVQVVAPSSMTFTSTVDGYDSGGSGKTATYTATENTFDGGLWSVVSLRDPSQTRERVVDVGDLSFVLESFPDDERWSAFVAETVTGGLPTLVDLVDNPWPGGLQRIREDAAPSLKGFDGWFDPSGDEIVVGEQLDADLIFHELSHAWVSGERFDERWLFEGLAQAIAERAVRATGGAPAERGSVSRSAPDALALNEWDGDAGNRSADVDSYAYPASYRVMTTLLADLDDDEFAAVVGAGIRGERAYDPPGTVTPSAGRTSWADWLDLVQTRGGVQDAPEVFVEWVLTPEQESELPARARERAAYAQVDSADGVWLPPEGLRDAMSSWDFERAGSVRAAVAGLGDEARAVQQAAERTGLAVPNRVRLSYERASLEDDYAALTASLPAAAEAITAVGAARRAVGAVDDPFTSLGAAVLGVQDRAERAEVLLDDGEVDQARAAAEDATDRADWSLPLGLGLPLVVLLVVIGGVWFTVLAVRGRPTPRSSPPREPGDDDQGGAQVQEEPGGEDEPAQSTRSILVLPRVFGLTRSRSRNSATPSS